MYGVVPVSLCRGGLFTDAVALGERAARLAVEILFSRMTENNKQENSNINNATEMTALLVSISLSEDNYV